MDNDNELKYWLALSHLNGFGPLTITKLIKHFGTVAAVWRAGRVNLTSILSLRQQSLFIEQRNSIDIAKCWRQVLDNQLTVLPVTSPKYPKLLKEIHDPPILIYVRGNIAVLQLPSISVVGTRRATAYGRQVVKNIIEPLANNKFVIVSGLAHGIDAYAHQATLQHGKTVAVLAGGLDAIYPAANESLAKIIVENGGCLISEYPPGTEPVRGRFPQRNRIIAGLSRQTIVIEAGQRSGALITAYQALSENRDVAAVPGSIFSPQSVGTNRLIAKGAQPIMASSDILEDSPDSPKVIQKEIPSDLSAEAIKILETLSDSPQHIDNIIEVCNLDPSVVGAELALLELFKLTENIGNQLYIRLR